MSVDSEVRSLWQKQPLDEDRASVAEIEGKARAFERRVRLRNRREELALVVVSLVFTFYIWMNPHVVFRIGCVLIMLGAALVMAHLRKHGRTSPLPGAAGAEAWLTYRARELEHQRDLLWAVPRWYLAPLVPGLIVFLIAVGMETAQAGRSLAALWATAALCIVTFVGIGLLNRRAARRLDGELAELRRS